MPLYRITVTVEREVEPSNEVLAEVTVFNGHAVTGIRRAARGAEAMLTPPGASIPPEEI